MELNDTSTYAPVYEDYVHYSKNPFKGSIVFTNGCFDILHPGHISYLRNSRQLGDHLVVGLNSDASVNRLKGINRPIHQWKERAFVLSALRSVDAIIKFEDDTPMNLIRNLCPAVITKGGDYTLEKMIGREFVESYGGKVIILPFLKGFSSSGLIENI